MRMGTQQTHRLKRTNSWKCVYSLPLRKEQSPTFVFRAIETQESTGYQQDLRGIAQPIQFWKSVPFLFLFVTVWSVSLMAFKYFHVLEDNHCIWVGPQDHVADGIYRAVSIWNHVSPTFLFNSQSSKEAFLDIFFFFRYDMDVWILIDVTRNNVLCTILSWVSSHGILVLVV